MSNMKVTTGGSEPAVQVIRGDAVEAVHHADIAVVDKSGRLTHYLGNPDTIYMARSALKPFQALPLIESGGFDHFGFSEQHLALMCSSHSGTDEHRDQARSALEQAGLKVADLQCGAAWPLYIQFEDIFPVAQDQHDPLRNDCSGKHAGFLALAKFLGEPLEDYLNPENHIQKMIKESVAVCCEYPSQSMKLGIDGCSAPNFSMPVKQLAVGFKNLASGSVSDKSTSEALQRAKAAMTSQPYLVAGHKRFCYDFMRLFGPNGVTKLGAESIQGIGFADPSIGIAIKVADGAGRALGPICIEVLKQMGLLDMTVGKELLGRYECPETRNARDIVTGRIMVDFELKKA